MKSNENKELIMAIEELEKERGIDKNYLLESLEVALTSAYKKNFDSADNVKIEMDPETGEIHIYAQKEVVEKVLSNNPQSVADYKAGKDRALGFLVGQAMKETKGKANPQMLNKMFLEQLSKE